MEERRKQHEFYLSLMTSGEREGDETEGRDQPSLLGFMREKSFVIHR